MFNSALPEIYLITPPITNLEKFLQKLQKVIEKNNAFLFYKYEDGTTLKKIIIK